MSEHDSSASKRRKIAASDDDESAFAPSQAEEQNDKQSQKLEELKIAEPLVDELVSAQDKGKGKETEEEREREKEAKEADASCPCSRAPPPSCQQQQQQRQARDQHQQQQDVASPPAIIANPFDGAAADAAAAPDEAEHGIQVDDFDEGDPFTDDGYESDSRQSASTSLASTMYNYVTENGRRYHKFREGAYNFPNDDSEQEREDMKHAMVVNLCQVLHFAPLNNPQRILDMGTGTGIWAIEMGDQYPSATILGVDLSPIQPAWVPPNVKFMVDDVESPWLHPENHFDFVHARHTVMAIKDWPKLLRNAYRHTKPGGWLELQEIYHFPQANHPAELAKMQPLVDFWDLVAAGLAKLGVDFRKTLSLAQLVREAGFVNVTERVFHVPNGTWPKNRMLKICGLWWKTIILDGLSPIALGPLTRGLGWTKEEIEVFLVGVRQCLKEGQGATYMPLHVIYAQRPETDGPGAHGGEEEEQGTFVEDVGGEAAES